MQSNGGLTDAARFQGKDAILSGPAGGIVGMVKTAEAAGHHRLIGFDMGGTSTDVSHYAGVYERSFETEVAGVRMRAPMMDIHTVAAGGGSICSFRDGRYQVGPESAGANPGPAAYRRGGPLTVTDCNVMLGRLAPAHFPPVFRPRRRSTAGSGRRAPGLYGAVGRDCRGNRPAAAAPRLWRRASCTSPSPTWPTRSRRYRSSAGMTSRATRCNCFGGAGGQHACLVADALGMTRVLLHPFAGVLSAYGMGLAEISAIREAQADCAPDDPVLSTEIARLSDEAKAEVAAQGVDASEIRTLARAHLRYDGSHQTLEVPYGSAPDMQAAFEAAHLARFGFIAPDRALRFEMLAVEALGRAGESAR